MRAHDTYEGSCGGLLLHAPAGLGCASPSFTKVLYGATASYHGEPVDQIAPFLIAGDMRLRSRHFQFFPLVASRFSLLNTSHNEKIPTRYTKQVLWGLRKNLLHKALSKHVGVKSEFTFTEDAWKEQIYWRITEGILNRFPAIIPKKNPFPGRFHRFADMPRAFIPGIEPAFADRLAQIEAPRLYALFEVSQVKYLQLKFGVDGKIGPASEKCFDDWICKFVATTHFRQPVDLRSCCRKVMTLTPYIGRLDEHRIFFVSDDESAIQRKLIAAEKTCKKTPVFNFDPATQSAVFNPIVQYAVYAVEAARLANKESIQIDKESVTCGGDVIRLAEARGIHGWASDVSKALWTHLVQPVNEKMNSTYNLETVLEGEIRKRIAKEGPSEGLDELLEYVENIRG